MSGESWGTPWPLDLQPRWRLPSELGYGPDKPPDKYILGDIWVQRHRIDSVTEAITVDKASPHILIGDELLRDLQFDVRRYQTCKWVRLEEPEHPLHEGDCPSCFGSPLASHEFCFDGMTFHVDARNQHLVYVIGRYRPGARVWEARWPD